MGASIADNVFQQAFPLVLFAAVLFSAVARAFGWRSAIVGGSLGVACSWLVFVVPSSTMWLINLAAGVLCAIMLAIVGAYLLYAFIDHLPDDDQRPWQRVSEQRHEGDRNVMGLVAAALITITTLLDLRELAMLHQPSGGIIGLIASAALLATILAALIACLHAAHVERSLPAYTMDGLGAFVAMCGSCVLLAQIAGALP
ncbi:hypothetical protein [Labrys sp. WJW]|uniref:hypothetical protein n=1 Tax=Labrys sp. WJW TaxID=1737983 RepID=UPI0012EAB51D|nr:hypothetical protein [Labrys sp. WJW]